MCASTIVVSSCLAAPRRAVPAGLSVNRARFNSTVLLPIDLTSKSSARSRRRVKMSPYAFRDADKSRMGSRSLRYLLTDGLLATFTSAATLDYPRCTIARGDKSDPTYWPSEVSSRPFVRIRSPFPSLRRREDGTGSRERRRPGTISLGLTPDRARQRHGNYVDNAADCRFIMTS